MSRRGVEYSEEIAQRFLDMVQDGRTISHICDNEPDMPSRRTITRWFSTHPEFARRFDKAQQMQADVYFDKVIDTAEGRLDDEILASIKVTLPDGKIETPNSQRHMILAFREQRIRAYQYAAAKLKPRAYGDKQQMEISGNPDKPITTVTRIEIVAPQLQIAPPPPSALPVIEAKVTERERVNANPS